MNNRNVTLDTYSCTVSVLAKARVYSFVYGLNFPTHLFPLEFVRAAGFRTGFWSVVQTLSERPQ